MFRLRLKSRLVKIVRKIKRFYKISKKIVFRIKPISKTKEYKRNCYLRNREKELTDARKRYAINKKSHAWVSKNKAYYRKIQREYYRKYRKRIIEKAKNNYRIIMGDPKLSVIRRSYDRFNYLRRMRKLRANKKLYEEWKKKQLKHYHDNKEKIKRALKFKQWQQVFNLRKRLIRAEFKKRRLQERVERLRGDKMKLLIQDKDVKVSKLTIAANEARLKFPLGFDTGERERIVKFAQYILDCYDKSAEARTLRGTFCKVDDGKYLIRMHAGNNKEFMIEFVEKIDGVNNGI